MSSGDYYAGVCVAQQRANREIRDLEHCLADWQRQSREQALALARTREALRQANAGAQELAKAYDAHIDALMADFNRHLQDQTDKIRAHYAAELAQASEFHLAHQAKLIEAIKVRDQRIDALESAAATAGDQESELQALQQESARLHQRMAGLEADNARQAASLANGTALIDAMQAEIHQQARELEHAAYTHALLEDLAGGTLDDFIAKLHGACPGFSPPVTRPLASTATAASPTAPGRD